MMPRAEMMALVLADKINPKKFICTDPREFKVYRTFQWDARDLRYISPSVTDYIRSRFRPKRKRKSR
jgi:hypothetical protein